MARISKIEQLEARKGALVAESEVYRQTLKLEIQNLRLYGLHAGSKVQQFKGLFLVMPLVLSLTRILSGKFSGRRRRPGWRRLFTTALMGWRLYRKFGPSVQSMVTHWFTRKSSSRSRAEDQTPAANI
jgi:hypothetical protein